MHFSGFERFAWAASFVGQILLLFVLFVRRRAGLFPIFTTYIAKQAVTNIILYLVYHHLSFRTYQNAYWSLNLLDEILQLLVLYELAVHVFCPMGVWARDVRWIFLSVTVASAVLAVLLAWIAEPSAPRPIETLILRSNFFSAALMSELFVGMVVLSTTVGLPWKTHVARIAQGLGAYSIVCVGLDIVANFAGLSGGAHTYTELSRMRSFAYLVCEGYWIVMLWAEAPAPRELPETMRIQIYTLQQQVENDLRRIRSWRKN